MTLEKLIKAAGQDGDHFVEDPNVPFGVRSMTPAGQCVLDWLRSAYEHYECKTDEEFRDAAAADIAEIALGVESIAVSILESGPTENAS